MTTIIIIQVDILFLGNEIFESCNSSHIFYNNHVKQITEILFQTNSPKLKTKLNEES